MIAIRYQYVRKPQEMVSLAKEMIEYALAHPFCHQATMDQAETDPTLETERFGPMMRVKGATDVMEGYNRFIAFKSEQDGSIQAIQAAFTIASDPDLRGVRQLTLVENLRQELDKKLVKFIIGHFFDDQAKLMVMDTPPHVSVVLQVPDHDSDCTE